MDKQELEGLADKARVYGKLLSPHEQEIWMDGFLECVESEMISELARAVENLLPHYNPLKGVGYIQGHGVFDSASEALAEFQAAKEKLK